MKKFVNHKPVEIVSSEVAVPVLNSNNERAFDFRVERTGIFIYVRCYCSKSKDKKKIVRICLIDIIKQIWNNLSDFEKSVLKPEIEKIISE